MYQLLCALLLIGDHMPARLLSLIILSPAPSHTLCIKAQYRVSSSESSTITPSPAVY